MYLEYHSLLQQQRQINYRPQYIKVWTFQSPNNPAFEYKAETTYDVSLERAVNLLLNVEQAPRWAPYVAKVQTLNNDSKKGEFTLYMVLDFPFPLTDRDLVVKGKMMKMPDGSIVIKNNAITGGYPKQNNRIRLTNYQGDWTFQRLSNNKVKVTTTDMPTLKVQFRLVL